MISARRPERRLRTLGLALLLGSGLWGCASLPGPQQSRTPPAPAQTDNPVTPAASQTRPSAASAQDSAEQPPDLWARIREGLALPASERSEVRHWVQFYAARKRHLRDSTEAARPYLRHIVDSLEQRGMPTEIALLPIVESSFNPFAGGGRRAAGLWQFMPITARRFGLERDQWYEGRRDVLRSTAAALDYLSWLHGRFDDWLLALAAYNAGEGRIDQARERARAQGKPADFWHLELPTETHHYIPKLLALRELVMNAERYALRWPNMLDLPAFEVVDLPARTSLAAAAQMLDVPEKRLRQLNPALRGGTTQPGGPHQLLVPADQAEDFRLRVANIEQPARLRWRRHRVAKGDALSEIAQQYDVRVAALKTKNALDGQPVQPGQELLIPDSRPKQTSVADNKAAKRKITVQRGDSLWVIARRNQVSVNELRAWNNLASNAVLQPGQTLTLGGGKPGSGYYTVRRGDSLWSIARRFDTRVSALRLWNALGSNQTLKPGQRLVVRAAKSRTVYYKVRNGDSLWSIASHFKVRVAQLKDWNSLGGGVIKPGQRLKIVVNPTG